mgnify:FL=1
MESSEEHFIGKIAQKAIVVYDNKVLLTSDPRVSEEIWELPGGRMNVGEEPRKALTRELKEELGVDFDIHEVVHMEQFLQGNEKSNAFVIVYRGTIKNPNQKFVTDSSEVSAVKWFSEAEVKNLKLFPEYKRALDVFFAAKQA